MKNHWLLAGVVAVAVLTGTVVARVSGDVSIHRAAIANAAPNTTAPNTRQQMARMIAETAARSAAQAAKAVIANNGLEPPMQTASAAAQIQPAEANGR